ncbi:MAG: signal protein [Pseudomonadota bacterium]|nr:signal protein [Pseudomonadota bacterium]
MLATLVLITLGGCVLTATPAVAAPRVAPDKVAHISANSDADLAAAWWRWAAAFETPVNPVLDATGEDCMRGQSGDVWFLAGSVGETLTRTCSVPGGQSLFFPVLNCAGGEECRQQLGKAVGRAELDGARLRAVALPSTAFNLTGVAGNPFTGTAETVRLVTEGDWLHLPPLPAGRHTLRIVARSSAFLIDVTYVLNVAPG